MENPIKMDDLGVPLFLETPMFFFQGLSLLNFEGNPTKDAQRDCLLVNWAMKKTYCSCLGVYSGWKTTQLYRDYNKPWNKDPY